MSASDGFGGGRGGRGGGGGGWLVDKKSDEIASIQFI